MHEIYYATSNAVKFAEADQFFKQHAPDIKLTQYDKELIEIQSLDQQLIAIDKAKQAWNILQKPVLAEDAGIYFEKYNQFPGTLSKYVYEALGMSNLLKLVDVDDPAFFQLHLVYYFNKNSYEVFKGRVQGTLTHPSQLVTSIRTPFDFIFVPEGTIKTYNQLRQSNELSPYNYRVRALEHFMQWYNKNQRRI